MAVSRYSMELAGRTLTLETGRMAKQAGGAVLVTYGETVVLATATTSEEPREGIDFFPLQVEFEEKMYAAGKIPGGFIKREGRPTENAILTARLTDRPLRPALPEGLSQRRPGRPHRAVGRPGRTIRPSARSSAPRPRCPSLTSRSTAPSAPSASG